MPLAAAADAQALLRSERKAQYQPKFVIAVAAVLFVAATLGAAALSTHPDVSLFYSQKDFPWENGLTGPPSEPELEAAKKRGKPPPAAKAVASKPKEMGGAAKTKNGGKEVTPAKLIKPVKPIPLAAPRAAPNPSKLSKPAPPAESAEEKKAHRAFEKYLNHVNSRLSWFVGKYNNMTEKSASYVDLGEEISALKGELWAIGQVHTWTQKHPGTTFRAASREVIKGVKMLRGTDGTENVVRLKAARRCAAALDESYASLTSVPAASQLANLMADVSVSKQLMGELKTMRGPTLLNSTKDQRSKHSRQKPGQLPNERRFSPSKVAAREVDKLAPRAQKWGKQHDWSETDVNAAMDRELAFLGKAKTV